MKIKFTTLDNAERTNFAALTEDDRKAAFAKMDDAALDLALSETKAEGIALFALDNPTVADADKAEALATSMGLIEAEQATREAIVADAAKKFANARKAFAINDGVEDSEEGEESEEETEGEEPEEETEGEEPEEGTEEGTDDGEAEEGEGDATVTAASRLGSRALPKTSAASRIGRKAVRPAKTGTDVVIRASADIEGFSNGQSLTGMSQVAEAVMSRVKGFPKFNARAAEAAHEQSGGAPVLNRFGAASFDVSFDKSLTASRSAESGHAAVKAAVEAHVARVNASINGGSQSAMSAAMAWCSPSEVVYNWIADYVVDGLMTLPEVAAPRGGLMMTEGPRLAQTTYGTPEAVDNYGFGGTEAEMEAGYIKTCETIECPEFVDHRLDFDGYCWKIPILTEATFPELVADAMRLSDVLYAHKMNRRFIGDVVAGSSEIDATTAFGAVQIDTLEAFTQVAIKERRWWNLGVNAAMEVKLPQEALDIFKFDMARRSGLALSDTATDQKVNAHFAAHNLSVEYISDFEQRYGAATPTADWPDTIKGIMYPAGTWVKSVKPVINLSAVYDAASLSENEYTGVFFEQGVMTIKRGYRSHVIEVPVCVTGATGANDFVCRDERPNLIGSF